MPSTLSLSNSFRVLFVTLVTYVLASAYDEDASLAMREYNRESNASLLWGPYRSNLYFGVRPRIPHSLLTSLMWYNADTYTGIGNLRHSCEQGDDMAGFGWEEYDPRVGGRQVFRDTANNIEITTEFVKSEEGNDWAVRVKGKPIDGSNIVKTGVVFYAGLEGDGSLNLKNEHDGRGIDGVVKLKGKSPELGIFELHVTDGPKSNKHPKSGHILEEMRPSDRSHYASLTVPDDNVWLAKDIFLTFAQDSVNELTQMFEQDNSIPPWNVYLIQETENVKGQLHFVQKIYQGSFTFDILYNTKKIDDNSPVFTPKSLTDSISQTSEIFTQKFEKAFTFQAPFDDKKYLAFAKEMYSNLVGGIGYFYGTHLVDRSYAEEYEETEEKFWEAASEKLKEGGSMATEEGPFELFTMVPSRSFFPRGFYWDEGFHLIPVLEYDSDLVLEIMKSWFFKVDSDGWIAREQILGPEASSKVPQEFQVQYPHYANPPTLMLLLSRIISKISEGPSGFDTQDFFELPSTNGIELGHAQIENPDLLLSYIKKVYPFLQSHYDWFRQTQKGSIKEWDREAYSLKEGYRWRGRTPRHCLTSGLDDYPRADVPHTGELHVDLLCWVGMMTRSMKDFANAIGEEDDAAEYEQIENAIIRNIDDLHWSEKNQMYCDVSVDEYDEDMFVCHKGYISLFPFLLKLVPANSDHLMSILDMISDPEELWSEYGIRSLSKSDEYFGTEENYWRGPIWINMNYMVLDSLKYYAEQPEPSFKLKAKAAEVYGPLRVNIVNNIYNNWKTTGYAWEQYESITGKGQGVKHFLGWTSLAVNIMAMPETI